MNWLVQYVGLAALGTVVFLGAYRVLMRPLRPRGGWAGSAGSGESSHDQSSQISLMFFLFALELGPLKIP
jgi:hypothetical protein